MASLGLIMVISQFYKFSEIGPDIFKADKEIQKPG